MDDVQPVDGLLVLRLSVDEAVVLHEALSRAEAMEDLRWVELGSGAERRVASALMLALRAGVPNLGTDAYGSTVAASTARIDRMG